MDGRHGRNTNPLKYLNIGSFATLLPCNYTVAPGLHYLSVYGIQWLHDGNKCMYAYMFACMQPGGCIHTRVYNSDVSIVSVQLETSPTALTYPHINPGRPPDCCLDQYKYGESVMHYVKHPHSCQKRSGRRTAADWLIGTRCYITGWLLFKETANIYPTDTKL